MIIEYIETQQDWSNETTIHWFLVDGQDYGLAVSGPLVWLTKPHAELVTAFERQCILPLLIDAEKKTIN